MNGQVDLQGRALLTVSIRTAPDAATSPVEVWIDTGFTGELNPRCVRAGSGRRR